MTGQKPEVIIIRETTLGSLAQDAGTFLMVFAIMGAGVWMESAAMQWLGFVGLVIGAISTGISKSNRSKMTIEQARQRLDEIEGRT